MRVLEGRRALVTGATRGIGRSIATAMAGAGAHVLVTGRDAKSAGEVVEEIVREGGRADFVTADLTDPAAADGLVDLAFSRLGGLDILVNNAGVDDEKPVLDYSVDDWSRILELNLTTPFRLCRTAGPRFLDQGRGVIINVASILGLVGVAESCAYVAAKHGLVGLTKVLALEWSSRGVRVNAIAPGLIQTDMTRYLWENNAAEGYIKSRIPAQRMGQPKEIGGVAVFLASDAAEYIHGEVIAVDGGYLAT